MGVYPELKVFVVAVQKRPLIPPITCIHAASSFFEALFLCKLGVCQIYLSKLHFVKV